jgi:hypothetical protein
MKKEKPPTRRKNGVAGIFYRDARLSPKKYMFNFALWKVTQAV